MGEVLFIDLESDRHSPLELRTIAETVVRRRLLAVPGVSQVIATGGEQKQYEVVARSRATGGAAGHARRRRARARRRPIRTRPPASRSRRGRNISCAASAGSTSVDAIGAVPVKTTGTTPVLVRDVGTVREGAAIKRGEGSHNARPAVIIGIQKQPAVNTLELTERIDATLDDIQRALPQGMRIHRDLFRQADFIEQSLHNLFKAFLEGAGLVIVVVVVFLMNIRAAVITLLALPLSLVAAVIAMDRFGLTINSMSLGGLAIAIGELVDDAIIDVENVVRRLRENAAQAGRGAAARSSTSSIGRAPRSVTPSSSPPSSSCSCSCRCSCLSSVEGRLLRPLGFAYVVALIGVAGRGADGHAGALLLVAAELTSDRGGRGAASDAAVQGDLRALAGARLHLVASRARHGGGAARRGHRGDPRGRPIVPAGVQRRRADGERGHHSGHEPGRLERARATRSSGCCSACRKSRRRRAARDARSSTSTCRASSRRRSTCGCR